MKQVTWLIACLVFIASVSAQRPRGCHATPKTSCGDNIQDEASCPPTCCWNNSVNAVVKCFITPLSINGIQIEEMTSAAKRKLILEKPENYEPVQERVGRLTGLDQGTTTKIQQRNLNFNTGALLSLSLLEFPVCPVPTPFCHRTPCNQRNRLAETDPFQCLSDPTCCFDEDLFLYKVIFGHGYMGGAPVCYNGPTSSRYRYIASTIRPWNPFFQNAVTDIFEDFFDNTLDLSSLSYRAICTLTSTLDVGIGQVLKCGWKGINRLQCQLKGCCYNDKEGRCNYPTTAFSTSNGYFPFGQSNNFNSFGPSQAQEYYPELIAQYPEDSVCQQSSIFNPRLYYGRLPCQCVDNPEIRDILFGCPRASCCPNYLALIPELNNLAFLGGGGLHSANIDPTTLFFLNRENIDIDILSHFYCPYYYFPFPGLPDISDSAEDCCKQHSCYHIKRQGGAQPRPRSASWGNWGNYGHCTGCGTNALQTRTRQCVFPGGQTASTCQGDSEQQRPCVNPPCATWSNWGQYGQCNAACGSRGSYTRSRQCGNGQFPNSCSGPRTQQRQCNGPPCATWLDWGPYGSCDAQCGSNGFQTRSRQCNNGVNACSGQRTQTRRCNGPDCASWSNWSSFRNCNAPCGGNGRERSTRHCTSGNVPANTCPGLNERYRSCRSPSCYILSWGPWGSCMSNCRRQRIQICHDRNSQPTDPNNCDYGLQAGNEEEECTGGTCVPNPPRPWVSWDSWGAYTDCSTTCGEGTRYRERLCLYGGDSNSRIDPALCRCAFGNENRSDGRCNLRSCGSSNTYTNWTNWGSCTCNGSRRSRARARCAISDRDCKDPKFQHQDCGPC